ncbi:glutamic acid-rich protein-like [Hibiscus syriacus]|uniref:glutamic acid-rich protein-like n=1 Tax=Hibiscus syriacus TaxID=106335 RepID=UPI001924C40E|nr:glutamic acid-rich protein-like [Hibiscus syriacus]
MSNDDLLENILQETPTELDQQKQEEKCFEKDREKKDDDEEETAALRKDDGDENNDEKDNEEAASRKDDDDDENNDNDDKDYEVATSRKDDEEKEVEECKTPTSSDHKISMISSCPPTPRKKAMMSLNYRKRKLTELFFFETTRSEERSYQKLLLTRGYGPQKDSIMRVLLEASVNGRVELEI